MVRCAGAGAEPPSTPPRVPQLSPPGRPSCGPDFAFQHATLLPLQEAPVVVVRDAAVEAEIRALRARVQELARAQQGAAQRQAALQRALQSPPCDCACPQAAAQLRGAFAELRGQCGGLRRLIAEGHAQLRADKAAAVAVAAAAAQRQEPPPPPPPPAAELPPRFAELVSGLRAAGAALQSEVAELRVDAQRGGEQFDADWERTAQQRRGAAQLPAEGAAPEALARVKDELRQLLPRAARATQAAVTKELDQFRSELRKARGEARQSRRSSVVGDDCHRAALGELRGEVGELRAAQLKQQKSADAGLAALRTDLQRLAEWHADHTAAVVRLAAPPPAPPPPSGEGGWESPLRAAQCRLEKLKGDTDARLQDQAEADRRMQEQLAGLQGAGGLQPLRAAAAELAKGAAAAPASTASAAPDELAGRAEAADQHMEDIQDLLDDCQSLARRVTIAEHNSGELQALLQQTADKLDALDQRITARFGDRDRMLEEELQRDLRRVQMLLDADEEMLMSMRSGGGTG
eukprot:TRINITY_DN1020_c0_g4_i1.p1 TRINITY_DN1020_c0_g4~~TRINITY_DN1020_c0_g4_i1.p1  ORF type:complete len:546 (+),score=208.66 TRINITY_DN1020_c0_g4_i1:79-1638(+)